MTCMQISLTCLMYLMLLVTVIFGVLHGLNRKENGSGKGGLFMILSAISEYIKKADRVEKNSRLNTLLKK